MKQYFKLVLAAVLLLSLGAKGALAGQLSSTYDLGDNYSLHLGKKAGGFLHSRNIIGLRKNDFLTDNDAMTFTLNRPYNDFGGDSASLGFIYTNKLKDNVTSTFSLNGGPTDGLISRQDVAVSFYIHIKLQ